MREIEVTTIKYICEKCNSEYFEGAFDLYKCQICNQRKCLCCDGITLLDDNNIPSCKECAKKIEIEKHALQNRGVIYNINEVLYRHEKLYSESQILEMIRNSEDKYKSYFDGDEAYDWEDYFMSVYDFDYVVEDVEVNLKLEGF